MSEFGTIYNEYYRRVYAFLNRMTRDPLLSEELTQETFFQAYLSMHSYNGKCELFTWLAAIAKNVYFKYLRKNAHEIVPLPDETDEASDAAVGDYELPEEDVIEREQSRLLRRCIDSLPDKYRDVTILRVYAELQFSQIAKTLKISENSAKVIFCRAKNMLGEMIGNENGL